MIRCTLNGNTIHSLADIYDQISAQLSLPEHFGRNLDALWDVLSTDVEGPIEIVWKNADASRKALGPDFERVQKVFRELKKKRGDFVLLVC